MDKFVVKAPKSGPNPSHKSEQSLKQAALTDLKRVVVVDDLVRIKAKLEENKSNTVLLECLNTLNEKIPSRKILIETKIGRTVKRLCTHEDTQVRRHARRLCQKWNHFFKEQEKLVPVEVKCDLSTTSVRNTVRSFIAKALSEKTNPAELSRILESELFHQCKNLVGKHYRRISRKVYFALESEETRTRLKTNQILASELVKEIIMSMPMCQQP